MGLIQLDKFFIGVVIFFVMILASTMLLVDIENNYEVDMSISGYLDNITEMAENEELAGASESMHTQILGGEVDEDTTENSMFKGGFSATKIIRTPLGLTKTIIQDIGFQLGIPKIFINYAFIALVILIIFTIIYLIFRLSIKT